MRRRTTTTALGLLLLLLPLLAGAENSTRIPGYTIHHNVLTTDLLSPEIAKIYGIQRSPNRAMLNISVVQGRPGMVGMPVPAHVRATARTIMGQIREVPLREIREGNAVYYIGDFLVGHRELLRFDIEVIPPGARHPYHAHLSHEFWTR